VGNSAALGKSGQDTGARRVVNLAVERLPAVLIFLNSLSKTKECGQPLDFTFELGARLQRKASYKRDRR